MSAYLLLFLIFWSCLSGHSCTIHDDEPINYIIVLMTRGVATNAQLDLRISPKLKNKFECFDKTCSDILKDHLKHFQSPIRVIGHTLNDTTSPKTLQAIRDEIHRTYDTPGLKLQAVVVIGDARLLSMFSVFMVGVEVPVLGLDTSELISFTKLQGLIFNLVLGQSENLFDFKLSFLN